MDKEEIFKIIEFYLEDNNIGLMVFPRELVADLAQIIALKNEAKLKEELIAYEKWTHVTPDHEFAEMSVNTYLKQRNNG